ncbi:hypothetical protein M3Y97_01060800 [Aphelenchoides bicaudatus]|nr:hypothetical protein M3Y97_01060800 [Aphelenchoides bicaudatus]
MFQQDVSFILMLKDSLNFGMSQGGPCSYFFELLAAGIEQICLLLLRVVCGVYGFYNRLNAQNTTKLFAVTEIVIHLLLIRGIEVYRQYSTTIFTFKLFLWFDLILNAILLIGNVLRLPSFYVPFIIVWFVFTNHFQSLYHLE